MKMFASGSVLALMLLAVTAYAQEEEKLPRLDDSAGYETAGVTAPNGSIFIIVCDEKPGQMIVLDSTGKWMSTVRDAKISFVIGEDTPSVTCTMWSGPFKPTSPTVKTWNLAQLKSVTSAEFQKMVDSLQTDPEAIRRQITEPSE